MSKNKHTPGPWIVDRAGVNVMDSKEPLYCLATCHENKLDKLQANAKLIAASPELLEALEACAAWLSRSTRTDDQEMAQDAFKAIAKAKGE